MPRRSKLLDWPNDAMFSSVETKKRFREEVNFLFVRQGTFPFDFLAILAFFNLLTRINYYRPNSSAENLIKPTHLLGQFLLDLDSPHWKSAKPNLVMFILAPLPFCTLFCCVSTSCAHMFTSATS